MHKLKTQKFISDRIWVMNFGFRSGKTVDIVHLNPRNSAISCYSRFYQMVIHAAMEHDIAQKSTKELRIILLERGASFYHLRARFHTVDMAFSRFRFIRLGMHSEC